MRTRLRVLGALVTTSVVAVAVPLLSGGQADAVGFTGGDLVVYRVGSGTGSLSNAAAPVFLDSFSGTGVAKTSVPLPVVASGTNKPLTASGLSRSEGLISRSADGRYLAATGYAAPVGATGPVITVSGASVTTSLPNSAPSTYGRTVALVDAAGVVDTSTSLTAGDTAKIVRSAVTDGSRVWVTGGNGGIQTALKGAATATTIAGTATSSFNSLTVQGGRLWASGATVGAGTSTTANPTSPAPALNRLTAVGSGTSPTSTSALNDVAGLPNNLLAGGYAFVDLTSASYDGTGLDTLYLANASERAGTVDKYRFDGTSWTRAGYIDLEGAFGLVADKPAGGNVVTLAVSTPTKVVAITEAGAAAAATSFSPVVDATPLATAPSGTEFRGLALAPVAGSGGGGGGTTDPTPTVTATPRPTTAPTTAAPSAAPSAPAGQVTGTASASDSRITRTGTWKVSGKGITSSKKNAKASGTVYGRTLVLTFATSPKAGKVKITVDGRTTTVNLYAKKAGKTSKTFALGTLGSHTLAVTVTGKKTSKSKGTAVTLSTVAVTP